MVKEKKIEQEIDKMILPEKNRNLLFFPETLYKPFF